MKSIILVYCLCFCSILSAARNSDDKVYGLKDLAEAEQKINAGESITLEVPAAYKAIKDTQGIGEDWSLFISKANSLVDTLGSVKQWPDADLKSCAKDLYCDTKELWAAVVNNPKVSEGVKQTTIKNLAACDVLFGLTSDYKPMSNSEATTQYAKEIKACQISLGKLEKLVVYKNYEISAIRNTTEASFAKAKDAIKAILVLFQKAEKRTTLSDTDNISGVTILVRGKFRFFDINVSGTDNYSWTVFDLRQ
jgi:hypothetical protein